MPGAAIHLLLQVATCAYRRQHWVVVDITLARTEMPDAAKAADTPVKPFFDQAVWSAVPSIIWVTAVLLLVYWFREPIHHLFAALVARLRSGAAFKVAGLEIGPASGLVATHGDFSSNEGSTGVRKDDGTRAQERDRLYEVSRGVALVHRLQRSTEEGQLYDVLIYVIPHKTSLAGVTSVEYFFGRFWGNKVFPSQDRSRGFPVVTSAYGPFLCTARVHFNDGTATTISRYIDFEMGNNTPARSAG